MRNLGEKRAREGEITQHGELPGTDEFIGVVEVVGVL